MHLSYALKSPVDNLIRPAGNLSHCDNDRYILEIDEYPAPYYELIEAYSHEIIDPLRHGVRV